MEFITPKTPREEAFFGNLISETLNGKTELYDAELTQEQLNNWAEYCAWKKNKVCKVKVGDKLNPEDPDKLFVSVYKTTGE